VDHPGEYTSGLRNLEKRRGSAGAKLGQHVLVVNCQAGNHAILVGIHGPWRRKNNCIHGEVGETAATPPPSALGPVEGCSILQRRLMIKVPWKKSMEK